MRDNQGEKEQCRDEHDDATKIPVVQPRFERFEWCEGGGGAVRGPNVHLGVGPGRAAARGSSGRPGREGGRGAVGPETRRFRALRGSIGRVAVRAGL